MSSVSGFKARPKLAKVFPLSLHQAILLITLCAHDKVFACHLPTSDEVNQVACLHVPLPFFLGFNILGNMNLMPEPGI